MAACVQGAETPDWSLSAAVVHIPTTALAAFACGCGVSPYAVVPGAFPTPLARSVAIIGWLGDPDTSSHTLDLMLWRAARPEIVKALDSLANGTPADGWKAAEQTARGVADKLCIPADLVDSIHADLSPKGNGKGRK